MLHTQNERATLAILPFALDPAAQSHVIHQHCRATRITTTVAWVVVITVHRER